MRKLGWALLIAYALFVGAALYVPGWVERGQNRIDGKPLLAVSEEAEALHQTLTIVDLHADTLLWKRPLNQAAERGQVDLPRLERGNVALQVFSSVTKSPHGLNYDRNSADSDDDITRLAIGQLQPVRTWQSLLQRTLWHGQKLDRAVAASHGGLRKVASVRDLDTLIALRARMPGPVGALLSVEGLHDLEGKAGNLDRLYDAGVRMAGLTHFFDNELAGSMHGEKKGGLTRFGRQIVRTMEAKGMIVDIAHCSHACVAQVLAMARRPVVSSHGGVQATCKINRNLTDEEIRGVARTGGVIGVGYWDAAICDTSPRAAAKAMRHVRDLVGIQYVALGSDFDGSVTTRFDTSQLVQVTQALMDEGFTPDDIRAVMGGNAIRVLRGGLVPMPELGQGAAR
ncbi:dipeptidase [Sphingomonas jaspsi]|uniref:dipeptidase n=1 Tax=Sphingomonas jaspsi TaxID=392409 RepID=UPI0004B3FF13|nr:dipeptidase [Sphingomonas jaspsi]